jgi:hypothetical protein
MDSREPEREAFSHPKREPGNDKRVPGGDAMDAVMVEVYIIYIT